MGHLGTRSCALRSLECENVMIEETEMDIYVGCGIDRVGARSYHLPPNI